ncbi:hypothetical protein LT706_12240 [Pseudomonas syringae pv. syringae]|uniref:hypothetical protein n=1 Tax=Pseudomonas syringae TaxID=317 RepID=UPI00200B1DE6|nr:hypothetical protein [Pseudomonas syringae]MCK9712292.1 hypothetical protein [Pseudomonas syringae pv. syringae]
MFPAFSKFSLVGTEHAAFEAFRQKRLACDSDVDVEVFDVAWLGLCCREIGDSAACRRLLFAGKKTENWTEKFWA